MILSTSSEQSYDNYFSKTPPSGWFFNMVRSSYVVTCDNISKWLVGWFRKRFLSQPCKKLFCNVWTSYTSYFSHRNQPAVLKENRGLKTMEVFINICFDKLLMWKFKQKPWKKSVKKIASIFKIAFYLNSKKLFRGLYSLHKL